MDIFPLFDHSQLGLKLALISPRFDVLVDKHFNGKSELTIWRTILTRKVKGMPKLSVIVDDNYANSVELPLPESSLPKKIRFKHLHIQYIDHSVIAFLHANKHIWAKGTNLSLRVASFPYIYVQQLFNVFVREIWPIFAPNIRRLDLPNGYHLHNLLRLTSPAFLTDLNQLNAINSNYLNLENWQDATSARQILSKWLHTPRNDGQSKRLRCKDFNEQANTEWVNNFKEKFIRATASVSYKIEFSLHPSAQIEQIELLNGRTNEKLTLTNASKIGWNSKWIMKRCPIFGESAAVQWDDENLDDLNTVHFSLYDVNICTVCEAGCTGYMPLSPPTEAGQSNETVVSDETGRLISGKSELIEK